MKRTNFIALILIVAGLGYASSVLVRAEGPADAETYTPGDSLRDMLDEAGENARTYFNSLNSHWQRVIDERVEQELIAGPEHLAGLLELKLPLEKLDDVFNNSCFLCHTDPDMDEEGFKFYSEEVRAKARSIPAKDHPNCALDMVNDVHFRRGISCVGCHGGDDNPDNADSAMDEMTPLPEGYKDGNPFWKVEFCGNCHSDPEKIRQFNPALPVDQVIKYKTSHHGKLFLNPEHPDPKAPDCTSCHGVHGILPASHPKSRVYSLNIPYTCNECHGNKRHMEGYTSVVLNRDTLQKEEVPIPTDIFERYASSVHGKALLERGDTGAPDCSDCHGTHAAVPPKTAAVAQVCRNCHPSPGALFDSSEHKKAFETLDFPECQTCHDNHAIQKPTDDWLNPGTEKGLCIDCHNRYAGEKGEQCKKTSLHFYTTLKDIHRAREQAKQQLDYATSWGMQVQNGYEKLAELPQALITTRNNIHSFTKETFDDAAGKAIAIATDAHQTADRALDEYRFRIRGLYVAVFFILVLAVSLYWKARKLES